MNAPKADAVAFHATLAKHGYGFQYAIQQHIFTTLEKHWRVEDAETPVVCNGKTIHIDLVLLAVEQPRLRIVAECKRPDPKQPNWYFVRTPALIKHGQLFFDRVVARRLEEGSPQIFVTLALDGTDAIDWPVTEPYGLGFPKGAAGNPSALEQAIAQVLRGTNGLINRFGEISGPFRRLPMEQRDGLLFPVIFTTAALWGSEVELRDSSLQSGDIPAAPLLPLRWLWLRQNMSPDLKHSLESRFPKDATSLKEWTMQDYARCIAIVSVDGIDEFLTRHEWRP